MKTLFAAALLLLPCVALAQQPPSTALNETEALLGRCSLEAFKMKRQLDDAMAKIVELQKQLTPPPAGAPGGPPRVPTGELNSAKPPPK